MKIFCIVGTRPNFVKMAALYRAISACESLDPVLVHTGQHYDAAMSRVFFSELGLPEPAVNLEVSGGSYVRQTCRIMQRLEVVVGEQRPALMVVVGDVNSTLAAALTAMHTGTPLAHVEAGLRSFDRTMPEEMNRVVIDHLADYLFVTEQSGVDNLKKEGVPDEKVHFVGNVMVDTLLANLERAKKSDVLERLGIEPGRYALVTLHRPANADSRGALAGIIDALAEVSRTLPVVFPVHPRTKERIGIFDLWDSIIAEDGFQMIDPLGYLDFLAVMAGAKVVFTDSGGIQEETTILGVPCITMRNNTERPATVEYGTNVIAGTDGADILEAFSALDAMPSSPRHPPLWDGAASERIVAVIERLLPGG